MPPLSLKHQASRDHKIQIPSLLGANIAEAEAVDVNFNFEKIQKIITVFLNTTKIMKKLYSFMICMSMLGLVKAQDSAVDDILNETKPERQDIAYTFKGTRIINGQSIRDDQKRMALTSGLLTALAISLTKTQDTH
jgi:hypothetical protein